MSTYSRESLISDAEDFAEWLRASPPRGFLFADFREGLGWSRHKAGKWLRSAKRRGVVVHIGRNLGWRYVPPEQRQLGDDAA